MSFRRAALIVVTSLLVVAACGNSKTPASSATSTSSQATSGSAQITSTPATTPPATVPAVPLVAAGQTFPADRCKANNAAGTITYLSSYDFAASASIVEILVAKQKGYFDDVCLDVKLKPSFSTDNYPLIAADEAQISSGGSLSEVVDYAGRNDAGFVALSVDGRTGIDALIIKDGQSTQLSDLKGKTIGVKGAITPSVAAMLKKAGLTEGKDYQTVLLDGYDPKLQIAIPEIVGFPGFKSNEPLQLKAAGIPFKLYDPADYGIPGSFGVLYSNSTFLGKYPTAAEDFMRAAMKGLADALADPVGAANIAVDMINASGNAQHLSPDGEVARWSVESKLVAASTTVSKLPIGVPDIKLLETEVKTYADIGLFDGQVPDLTTLVDAKLVRGVYDSSGQVIWPSK